MKGTWAEEFGRPFSNSLEFRPGIDSGLSVYLAANCDEDEILRGFAGAGLVALVFDEIRVAFVSAHIVKQFTGYEDFGGRKLISFPVGQEAT